MKNTTCILITGGAGFIGTNIIAKLVEDDVFIVVVDNLSNSYKKYIDSLIAKHPKKIIFYKGNFGNKELLDSIFTKYDIDVVVHLAAKKYIKESMLKSNLYKETNVDYLKTLLDCMEKNGVNKIIFPSSISVYGNTNAASENDKLLPLSVYAETKIKGEEEIKTWAKKNKASYVILRLSNPIGANLNYNIGDCCKSKYSNLIEDLNTALVNNEEIMLNGNNHKTEDGTAVRDFVNVKDVAKAFILAIQYKNNEIFNIGYGGNGVSVLSIIKELENSSGKKLNYKFGSRREGDCSISVSNIKKAKELLKFKPKNSLKETISECYEFFINNKK